MKIPLPSCDLSGNPQSHRTGEACRAIGENIKQFGQKVPLIGFHRGERFVVADGGTRLLGMRMVGLTEALVMDLGKEPDPSDLLMAQASIDQHHSPLPPVDRARLWHAAMAMKNLTGQEFAKTLGLDPSTLSRTVALLRLPPDIQERVNAGEIEWTKASALAAEENIDRLRELAMKANGMTRAAIADAIKKSKAAAVPAVKIDRVRCALAAGVSLTIAGTELDLDGAIDATNEALRAMKKARDEGLSVRAFTLAQACKAKKEAPPC